MPASINDESVGHLRAFAIGQRLQTQSCRSTKSDPQLQLKLRKHGFAKPVAAISIMPASGSWRISRCALMSRGFGCEHGGDLCGIK